MISFDGYKAVDLSPRIKARVHRVDGTIEEGSRDPYGKPWVMQEGRFPGDNSLFTLYSAPADDAVWHQQRMTSHNGSHVQGGKGHISHWAGIPADMKGLWEMPLDTFVGQAAVCNLNQLAPKEITDPADYPHGKGFRVKSKAGDIRGQEILPEHLAQIQQGDIVLMTSPFDGLEQPWLSPQTVQWLIDDRKIRMLGLQASGIEWQYDLKAPAPANSPIRRMLLGANIPIAHPLVNIDAIKADRVFYFGLPLNMPKFEASFIRAVAFEALETKAPETARGQA
ncbi:MAG: cyclase family protein [Pseudomonadales bacterium]